MKTLIGAIFLFTQISYAECKKPVTYLQQGEAAVCDGYLFSLEKEKEVREYAMKFEDLKNVTEKQDELIDVLNQRVYVSGVANENLRSEVKSLEQKSLLDKIVYFGLGIVLGLGVGKVLTK